MTYIKLKECSFTLNLYTDQLNPNSTNSKNTTLESTRSVTKSAETYDNIPEPNHYADTARWVRDMKSTRDFVREANNNMVTLSHILSDLFGWAVESKQLRKAINRM